MQLPPEQVEHDCSLDVCIRRRGHDFLSTIGCRVLGWLINNEAILENSWCHCFGDNRQPCHLSLRRQRSTGRPAVAGEA